MAFHYVTALFVVAILLNAADCDSGSREDDVKSRYQKPIAPSVIVLPTAVPAEVQTTSAAPEKDAKAEISIVFRCDGKDYWRSKRFNYSYDQAAKQCALGGGRLVIMRTKSVYDCIVKQLLKAGPYDWSSGSNYHIGLRRTGHGKDDFKWSDGSPLETTDYTNWLSGSPRPDGQYGIDNMKIGCAQILGNKGVSLTPFPMRDMQCTVETGFLCEEGSAPSSSPSSPIKDQSMTLFIIPGKAATLKPSGPTTTQEALF